MDPQRQRVIQLSVFIALNLLGVCTGQIPKKGVDCPARQPGKSIDFGKLAGQWFEIESSPLLLSFPFKCISIKLSPFFDSLADVAIESINRFSLKPAMTQKLQLRTSGTQHGKAEISWENFIMTTDQLFASKNLLNGKEIQVLGTDYKNWALVWMCYQSKFRGNVHNELIWILSRERFLSLEYYSVVQETLKSFGLHEIETRETDQSDCTDTH